MTQLPKWDDYFYEIAEVVAKKSKDKPKVGAVIVREEDHILLSTGYNGPPRKVLDLERRLAGKKTKLSWICHAEMNAIFNAVRSGAALLGGKIYVTKFPCVMCAGAIIQAGLVGVYTEDIWFWEGDPLDDGAGSCSVRTLTEAGVQIHAPKLDFKNARPDLEPSSQWARSNANESGNGKHDLSGGCRA